MDVIEAERFGLVNRVAPKGLALDAAITWAKSLTHFPQRCMRADRWSVMG